MAPWTKLLWEPAGKFWDLLLVVRDGRGGNVNTGFSPTIGELVLCDTPHPNPLPIACPLPDGWYILSGAAAEMILILRRIVLPESCEGELGVTLVDFLRDCTHSGPPLAFPFSPPWD